MARKTGVPTLLYLATKMCEKIAKFTPVIALVFPANTSLLAALTAANEACGVLASELAAVRDYGD